ncbi:unnamed protein product [Angiostrongylus costaricensis]|uniref:CCR4-NOT transcription complex subunit 4 n=1 Tax=Angiostrongylus costaricensis TaxID=334426 RepID=A0A158PLW2_ANGCS|nr:unnamed protein product [Angiostrongylus costaricensis]
MDSSGGGVMERGMCSLEFLASTFEVLQSPGSSPFVVINCLVDRTCVLKMSCSSGEQSDKECPLCMEQLEIDDLDFYPCKCEYQICRFCWHRLLTDENGLCPACRQPYPEDPVTFKPLSCADVQRIKDEKRLKQQAERLRISESRNHLANYRVLQKNLVYVVGLSPRVADPDILRKPEYFGRFGKILKVVVGTAPTANNLHAQPSHTAYVTYSKVEEALKAIQAVCNAQLDGRIVKASLGTTKYCSSFLRSQKCFKPECMYLHEIADSDISFTKEDMHMGKHAEYERKYVIRCFFSSIRTSVRSLPNMGKVISVEYKLLCGNEDSGAGMIPALAPVREAPAPLVNWQTLLGLSPQNATSNTTSYAPSTLHSSTAPQKTLIATPPPPGIGGFTSDDDLGFDPFNESSKGLARLLEEEKTKQPSVTSNMNHHTAQQQLQQHQEQHQQESFVLGDLWSRPSSLFASANTVQPHSSHLDMFTGLMSAQQSQQHQQQIQQQLHHQLNHHHTHHHHQTHHQHPPHRQQQYDPYCAPPPGLTPPQRSNVSSQSISDWQEGLKALLPNVNVRFVSDLEGGGHNGSNLHHLHQPQTAQHLSAGTRWLPSAFGLDANGRIAPHHMVQHTVPPPPGFPVPNR